MRVIRREEPALALLVERERAVRKREYRGIEELQAAIAHGADLLVVVELELASLDAPILLARLAGAERALYHANTTLAEELKTFRLPARRRVLAAQQVIGALEYA